jgi:hypothetical protein
LQILQISTPKASFLTFSLLTGHQHKKVNEMSRKTQETGKKTIHRSSISGRFVSERYAKKHPNTTQKENR